MVARPSQGCSIAIRMFMNDVVSDADVYRDRNPQANAGRENADGFMRKWPVQDSAAQRFAETHPRRCGRNHIVHLAGFMPKAELAGLNVASHALGRGADQSQFPIMDRPRAV